MVSGSGQDDTSTGDGLTSRARDKELIAVDLARLESCGAGEEQKELAIVAATGNRGILFALLFFCLMLPVWPEEEKRRKWR